MRLAAALVIILATGAAAAPAQRIYEGREAQALKCAWIFSRTAAVLQGAGMISDVDLETSLTVSARILQLHVSGSDGQKLAALRGVGERRDDAQTLGEFRSESRACLRMFPVD